MIPQKLILQAHYPEVQADTFVKQALLAMKEKKPKKISISIRLNPDVLEFLRQVAGKKYQPAINTILRTFAEYPIDELTAALDQADQPSAASKKLVSIRLDEDVLAWFKDRGEGYQTRINQVLRVFMLYSKPP